LRHTDSDKPKRFTLSSILYVKICRTIVMYRELVEMPPANNFGPVLTQPTKPAKVAQSGKRLDSSIIRLMSYLPSRGGFGPRYGP